MIRMIRHQHLTISIKDLAPKVSLTSHGAGAILRETKSATVSRRLWVRSVVMGSQKDELLQGRTVNQNYS